MLRETHVVCFPVAAVLYCGSGDAQVCGQSPHRHIAVPSFSISECAFFHFLSSCHMPPGLICWPVQSLRSPEKQSQDCGCPLPPRPVQGSMAHLYLFSADICVTEPAENATRTCLLQRIQTKRSAKLAFFQRAKMGPQKSLRSSGISGMYGLYVAGITNISEY